LIHSIGLSADQEIARLKDQLEAAQSLNTWYEVLIGNTIKGTGDQTHNQPATSP
jgi:hypothetical protein